MAVGDWDPHIFRQKAEPFQLKGKAADLDRLAAAHAAAMLIIDGWDDTPESVAARTIFNAMPTLIAELRQLRVERDRLREALAIYAESCDATETTPCGYQGSLCCMTARAALEKSNG